MKIAIIADVHDNLMNLEKCLDWCARERIEQLICCGDLTDADTLDYLAANFKGKIYLTTGNVDNFDVDIIANYKNIVYLGRRGGRLELGVKNIGICHEPYLIGDLIEKAQGFKYDIIFYGHTHKPWEDLRDGVRAINPGTLGGVFQKATFAIWDSESGEAELKLLELL